MTMPTPESIGQVFSNLMPNIDATTLFFLFLGFLMILFLIGIAIVLVYAIKKNWIILNWRYTIIARRPTGDTYITEFDKAAIIEEEKTKQLKFKLKSTGQTFYVPSRKYIGVNNIIELWCPTRYEAYPLMPTLVGFKGSPDPRVIKKLEAIEDQEEREKKIKEYLELCKERHIIYEPHIDPAVVNSVLTEATRTIEYTKTISDYTNIIALGVAFVVIILSIMALTMSAIKGMETEQAHAKSLEARAQADLEISKTLAPLLNETNKILNRTTTFPTPTR